MRGGKARKRRG